MDRTSAWRLARGDRREYRRPLSEAMRTRAYVPQKLVNQLTFSRRPHRLLLHPCCLLLSISNLSTFPYPSQALQQQYKHCHIGLCSDVIFTTGHVFFPILSFPLLAPLPAFSSLLPLALSLLSSLIHLEFIYIFHPSQRIHTHTYWSLFLCYFYHTPHCPSYSLSALLFFPSLLLRPSPRSHVVLISSGSIFAAGHLM